MAVARVHFLDAESGHTLKGCSVREEDSSDALAISRSLAEMICSSVINNTFEVVPANVGMAAGGFTQVVAIIEEPLGIVTAQIDVHDRGF